MYFCHPAAASALSTVSAVFATESGDVKIVLAGLAKTSLAPVTRGRRLVSNTPLSASLSDLEHPAASAARQIIANAKPRDLPRLVMPNCVSPPVVKISVASVISQKSKLAAPAASGRRNP